jgi:uncharacterized protein
VDPADLAAAAAILTVACALQGAVGFGANLMAAPLLVLIDPVLVPGPMVVVALVLNGLMMWRDRHPVTSRHLGLALAGRIPGSVLGAVALVAVPAAQIDLFFGALVLLAVTLSIGGLRVAVNDASVIGASSLSGFMGTAVSIGGPPIALLYQHHPGPQLRGSVSRLLVYGAAISIVTLIVFGQFGGAEAVASVALLPGVVLGFAASGPLARHLDRGHTRVAILVVSAAAAVIVIARAVW